MTYFFGESTVGEKGRDSRYIPFKNNLLSYCFSITLRMDILDVPEEGYTSDQTLLEN